MADPSALVVVWRVNQDCNLACAFCGFDRRVPRDRRSADVAEIDRFAGVLGRFSVAARRPVHVSWLGGEPLLWPHLTALSRRLARQRRISLGVTTNGLPLVSPRMRRLLSEHFQEITVSVDGLEAFHDQVRGAAGLFQQVRENVKRLAAAAQGRLRIRVNTILMQDNIDVFPQFCREIAQWGVSELTVNQLGGNDRPEFFPQHRLTPQQVECFVRTLPQLTGEMSQRGLTLLGSAVYWRRIAATAQGRRLRVDDCSPGSHFLFVDEQARVSPCSFTTDRYSAPLHQLKTVADLLQVANRFRSLRRAHPHPACGDCHATHVFGKFIPWPDGGSDHEGSRVAWPDYFEDEAIV